jgi:hypothetical protein
MASFNKVDSFVEAVAEKVHNLGSDTLKLALTNTAHTSSWTKLSDLTLATGAPANLDSVTLTVSSSAQTSGTYKLVIADKTMTASGAVGPFRYIYIYNDTATNDELIGYYDYGSSISLISGDTFTVDFDGTSGVLTIA